MDSKGHTDTDTHTHTPHIWHAHTGSIPTQLTCRYTYAVANKIILRVGGHHNTKKYIEEPLGRTTALYYVFSDEVEEMFILRASHLLRNTHECFCHTIGWPWATTEYRTFHKAWGKVSEWMHLKGMILFESDAEPEVNLHNMFMNCMALH